MSIDGWIGDTSSDLPDDLAAYIPRALEILTLYRQGDHAAGRRIICEYTHRETGLLLSTMAALAAGLLQVAYSATELPEDDWMPHFSVGLTGMFLDD